ncbi:MAG: DUF4186 domain-containing protein [Bacteriovoracaceae bacterium]|nr:DUF4186 domain-containing protein [Bacteriovoracaceae bacterium]
MNKISLERFKNSPFRLKFKLDSADRAYIARLGLKKIEAHAYDFIRQRLAPAYPLRDGKQTPFQGHPVFKAQHATATCCRGCLARWHRIAKGKELSDQEIAYAVEWIMLWITQQLASSPSTPRP